MSPKPVPTMHMTKLHPATEKIQLQPLFPRAFARKFATAGSVLAGILLMLCVSLSVKAQQIYLQTFNADDSGNWAVLMDYTMTDPQAYCSNNLVNFNFDYTSVGIPIAPHSAQFGSAGIHHGLKMSACYTNKPTFLPGGIVTGLSACPTNFSISQNFVMHADMWINVDCGPYTVTNTDYTSSTASFADNNNDSTASTVFYGCGYGTQGTTATTPGQTDAIWVGTLTDNGSSANVRMYGPSQTGSYQDFTHQTSGTTTPAFPGDPLVYNLGNGANGLGTRNLISTTANPPYTPAQLSTNLATGVAMRTLFPPSPVPLAQQIIYHQQTNNYSLPGFFTFGWHDVSVEKVGNVIIYKIDGNILATGNYTSAGTPAGNFLTFVASRTGTSVASATSATAAVYTNLNFVVFANIVVSNYDNVVNVSAPVQTCDEGNPGTPAVFDISRPSAGVPLTVTYTLTGTATNGSQYQTVPTTVTFSSTATDTNIYITPIDDGISSPTRTVILTLQSGAGYVGAGSAVVDILDGDTPTVDISSPTGAQAYGRYTNSVGPGNNADFVPINLFRRGKLTTGSDLNVNLSYGGAAVAGTDFIPQSSVTIPDGSTTNVLMITPWYNPNIASNISFTVSVASGSGYAIGNGPAIGTIVSANYPPAPVLLSDPLTDSSPTEMQNWNITYGTGDPTNDASNFNVDFGMNLSSAGGGYAIPPPPNGNATALHMTCNKNNLTSPAPGAVNVYYTNVLLSGDYAVRFNMNIIEGDALASATEGPIFGINHSGTCSNWWYGSGTLAPGPWSADGVWYYVTAQPGGFTFDYAEYTGAGGTNNNTGWTRLATQTAPSFAQAFKVNPGPFTCFDGSGTSGSQSPGQPANGSPGLGEDDSTWSDVEMKQQHDVNGNLIDTLSINHTTIFTYTNTTVWTNGYLMLGYTDPFGGVGAPEAGVYYANLQVVQLPALTVPTVRINSINITGGNVVVKFTTSSSSDTVSSFTLTSSGVVNGAYNPVAGASIISLGGNQFQATVSYPGGGQSFYRILHN